MKSVLLISVITIFCSCSSSKKINNYYYVEPFKEQEVLLLLKADSTFNLKDLTGCIQFEFTGRYREERTSIGGYFLLDSIKLQNVLSSFTPEIIFPLKNGDTAWIINRERIFIHKQPFIATSNNKKDLQEVRYKKLKDYYIGLLGQEGFLQTFGDGNRKEARKRLLDCKLPDINIK